MCFYACDEDGNIHPLLWEEFAEAFKIENRRVAETQIGDVRVLTVFLCIDHNHSGKGPPVLWETMVFGGDCGGAYDRYTSLRDAKAGHEAMVQYVREEVRKGSRASFDETGDVNELPAWAEGGDGYDV